MSCPQIKWTLRQTQHLAIDGKMSQKAKVCLLINYSFRATSMQAWELAMNRWSYVIKWAANTSSVWHYMESMLRENEEEKPRPIPLWVCVWERAISYWTSRFLNISSCFWRVFRPSSLIGLEASASSAPCQMWHPKLGCEYFESCGLQVSNNFTLVCSAYLNTH